VTSVEDLQVELSNMRDKLSAIRGLIEEEMAQPVWSIAALYHRRTDLRDAIYEVLER